MHLTSTRELFNRHSLRCTKQRLALYNVLRKCQSHPTAEELYQMVCTGGNDAENADSSPMSRATVYNTLEALCKAGLARRMPTANGSCRYDADTSEHLHFRFRDTSELADVPIELGSKLLANLPRNVLAEIESRMGVRIEDISVQLHGRRAG